MTEDALLQLLHRGKHLATSIIASAETKLAWVGVYPLDVHRKGTVRALQRSGLSMPDNDDIIYAVRAFEVERTRVNSDAWICEDDLDNKVNTVVIGDDALRAKLEEVGVRMDQLDLPYKSNYPI